MRHRIRAHKEYFELLSEAKRYNCYDTAKRELCLHDLFFLMVYMLRRPDVDRDWLYDRCREVQAAPDFHLDLWARAHWKSSIITFGLTIQDILKNPEITIGLFSFTRPAAKTFLRQIKLEFETNEDLKALFPDILYLNPKRESPKWSEDEGIIVRRQGNPKEATIEASGLIDGMPTGRHYNLRIYDDIITEKSVTTPEMIRKVNTAWELSQNLGSENGIMRVVGTRYHFADTYHLIKKRKTLTPREYPATEDGTAKGKSVLLDPESLAKKRRDQGLYTFSCQMLLNPVADESQELKPEWIRYWPAEHWENLNLYLFCDPAGSKKKGSDYTVFIIIGLGKDHNYYIVDWERDRLNLVERADVLFSLHRKYLPIGVYYEKYGKDSDIEHYQDRMNRENYRFDIREVGGTISKEDRIRKLIPLFEQGRFYIPAVSMKKNSGSRLENLTEIFVEEEYKLFPFSIHDDMLDCAARILDTKTSAAFPQSNINPYDIIPGSSSTAVSGWK